MAMHPAEEPWWAGCWASGAHGAAGVEEPLPSCAAWAGTSGVPSEWSPAHIDPPPITAYWTAISVRTLETNLCQIMVAK